MFAIAPHCGFRSEQSVQDCELCLPIKELIRLDQDHDENLAEL